MVVMRQMTKEWREMHEDTQDEMMLAMMRDERVRMDMMKPKMMAMMNNMKAGRRGKLMKAMVEDMREDEHEAMMKATMEDMMEVMRTDMKTKMRRAAVMEMTKE